MMYGSRSVGIRGKEGERTRQGSGQTVPNGATEVL